MGHFCTGIAGNSNWGIVFGVPVNDKWVSTVHITPNNKFFPLGLAGGLGYIVLHQCTFGNFWASKLAHHSAISPLQVYKCLHSSTGCVNFVSDKKITEICDGKYHSELFIVANTLLMLRQIFMWKINFQLEKFTHVQSYKICVLQNSVQWLCIRTFAGQCHFVL